LLLRLSFMSRCVVAIRVSRVYPRCTHQSFCFSIGQHHVWDVFSAALTAVCVLGLMVLLSWELYHVFFLYVLLCIFSERMIMLWQGSWWVFSVLHRLH
jgi:hypothetical protein